MKIVAMFTTTKNLPISSIQQILPRYDTKNTFPENLSIFQYVSFVEPANNVSVAFRQYCNTTD